MHPSRVFPSRYENDFDESFNWARAFRTHIGAGAGRAHGNGRSRVCFLVSGAQRARLGGVQLLGSPDHPIAERVPPTFNQLCKSFASSGVLALILAPTRRGQPMTEAQQFEAFMRNYQNMVFSMAMRLVANQAEAEDIAQEVFLKAYERFGELRESQTAGGWLKTVATNMSLNHLARRSEERRV